jgi:hypothetical protein
VKPLVLAALLACSSAPANVAAQIANGQEGEALVGVVYQNDIHMIGGARLSPVGLSIGVIAQPAFGKRRLGFVQQLSYVPVIEYDQRLTQFGEQILVSKNPLVVGSTWMRMATSEPELEGQNVFFAGAGVAYTILTPRAGSKITPMISIGARRWWARQLGLEISVQCGFARLGRTACLVPVTTAWPFG